MEWVNALVEAQDLSARLAAERMAAKADAERALHEAAQLEDSIAFRLGSLLLDVVRSPRSLLALPRALASLARHWHTRGDSPPGIESPRLSACESRAALPGAELVRTWHERRKPPPPRTLAELRMAAIVDPFTYASFAPDCCLLNLSADNIEQQIDDFRPHVLFVESAWRGKGGEWTHRISPCSPELLRLVDVCRRRAIPTVFWSKEDPAHFDDFLDAAALFDQVFTTDADCVDRYRAKLGHHRVGVLGFACQPAIHNPVEIGERRTSVSFAGSWYAKYPERSRDFEELVRATQQVLPVEIYDRNHDRKDPAFAYPAKYHPLIRGGVPYERIAEVYKACEFAITVNTITQSPTMFARRVYELLACNTIAVSNYSVGVDRTLGDMVLMANRDDIPSRLVQLRDSQDARHRLRLRGLREVMSHHTAAQRLAQVATAVLGPVAAEEARVWVVARVSSQEELVRVLDMFRTQRWEHKELLVVGPESLHCIVEDTERVQFVGGSDSIASLIPIAGWLAPWHLADYYGPSYLLDMMHATQYSREKMVGKSSFFQSSDRGLEMKIGDAPYSGAGSFLLRNSIIAREMVSNRCIDEVAQAGGLGPGCYGLVVDEFGYCMGGALEPTVSLVDVAD